MSDPATRAQQRVLLLALAIAAVMVVSMFAARHWFPALSSTSSRLWISLGAMAGAGILLAALKLRNPRR
jgi:hypothetical protein